MASREKILAEIYSFYRAKGTAPTIRRIREKTGLTLSVIYYHLRRLLAAGVVTKVDGRYVPVSVQSYLAHFSPPPLGGGGTPKIKESV